MKKTFTLVAIALLAATTSLRAEAPRDDTRFPRLDEQVRAARAVPGSELDKLIRANQDFSKLQARDAHDKIVPPWLKVWWQKGHPEVDYANPVDPTGGYPHVLKEIYEWMTTHQDFRPGLPEATLEPGRQVGDRDEDAARQSELNPMALLAPLAATAGTNVRASGAQTVARSESDIRINPWNSSKVIAASNNIGGSGTQGQYWSTDGGVTWGQTTLPLASGDSMHSDPTVDWSSDGTAWSTTMGINGNVLKVQSYRSANGGQTWTFDGTISGSQTNTDKQMQWVDHSASSAYKDQIYVIWHNGNPAFMNRRTATGWGTPIQVSNSSATGTCIGADVKTNSAGDVFGFFPDTGSRKIFVVKSTNGGGSYGTPVTIATTYRGYDIGVPSFNSRRALVYVSGGAYRNGATNNVYAIWTDLSGASGCNTTTSEPGSSVSSTCKTRIWFSRSLDGGATWSAAAKLNDQSSNNDQYNPFLAVDETNGNIGVIYYDTVANTGRLKSDVWYQLSTNGGASWDPAVKVTTAMTDETSAGADSGNQYGDYNSLSGYANKFLPSWTDRRSGGKEEIWTAPITTSSTPTYAISGNAGTAGATVTTSGGSATSDASSNYTISGLANGTYTLTPSKSGCTFSPSSQAVTISSANVTGINFTATCSTPTYTISGNAGTSGATVTAGSSTTTSDASSNYSMSGFAAGTYTVTPSKSGCTFSPASSSVTITSANVTGVNFTATCGSGDTQLTSGVTLAGQSVAASAWKYYYITVPAGATNLTFTTTAATADVDIYTQFNAKPTLSSYTCRPYTSSGNETCSATNPSAGTWWLGVYGYAAGSYSVTATVTTGGGGTTLFSDGFESGGWSTAQVSGTAGAWTFPASGTHPAASPHGGTKLAVFNSYTSASGSQTRVYRPTGFAVAGTYTSVSLKFWMYHDTGYSTYADKVQVQVSTNGGSTWTNVGAAIARYNGSTGWAQATIDLSAYKGTTVNLAFVGQSAFGNDEYLDDVTVTAQ